MSRLLLVFICLTWIVGVGAGEPTGHSAAAGRLAPALPLTISLFLLTFVMILAAVGSWSRWIAYRISARNFSRSANRLHWIMLLSRLLVVAWFAAGVFAFGWPAFVLDQLHLAWFDIARLPALVVGIAPPMLTWVGLWWAQFPADQALRQQGLVEHLHEGLPIHQPPSLATYLATNIRLQLLFTVVPILLMGAMHDGATWILLPHSDTQATSTDIQTYDASQKRLSDTQEGIVVFLSAGLVFVLGPELLRRILKTSPIPESPLRRRLEALCRRSGLKYRDILVWNTHFNVGNAAVMGLLPRFRYILLSDLLLERMEDEQIEAVFAHEVGHVVHRHMAWIIVFLMILVLLVVGPGKLASDWMQHTPIAPEVWGMITLVSTAGGFWLLFGYLSRRFERQADVYAARIMEATRPADPASSAAALGPLLDGTDSHLAPIATPVESHVGVYGAQLFASALHRVAMINNMPVTPRNRPASGFLRQLRYTVGSMSDLAHDWLHGSIPSRMNYLRTLSTDPTLTSRFDKLMARLYGSLLFLLVALAAYVVPMMVR